MAWIVAGIGALGCHDPDLNIDCSGGRDEGAQAIVGGSSQSPFTAITWEHRLVRLGARGGATTCSSVAVGADHVLTAGHCVPLVEVAWLGAAAMELSLVATHPTEDLALFRTSGETGLVPLPMAGSWEFSTMAPGTLVEAAGFGESGSAWMPERPHFAVLSVDEVDERSVTASAGGLGGGCFGDSGAPLLTRGADGSVVVLGVLASGSVSCRGHDSFVRGDLASDFVLQALGTLPGIDRTCENFPTQGRCFGEVSVACVDGMVAAQDCVEPSVCGWNAATRAYGCVLRNADPCGRTTEFGTCDGTVSRRCIEGTLRSSDCAACDARCVRSPSSGRVGCALPD